MSLRHISIIKNSSSGREVDFGIKINKMSQQM